MMKPWLLIGLGCLALACSERDAGWMVRPEGVSVGRAAEGVSSPPLPSRAALDGSDLARAFFPELALRPGRPALDPAKLLRVTARADGMEISTRGRVFRIRRLSGEGRPIWQPVDGEGADGLWVTSRIEELVVTEAGAAAYHERFEVTIPDGVVALRDAGDSLEFVDAGNVPVLRMHHALARDEGGRWRQGRATAWGAVPAGVRGGFPAFALRGGSLEVELSIGFEGFAGRVVVDPGWSSTGSMNVSRSYFTQTLLPTGQVLAAGGETSAGTISSAELYDPATGTWQATGPMLVQRSRHAATVLQDGRVLVAGGLDAGGAVQATAELYDPAAGTWQATGAMARARSSVAATLLRSGKALVVGGPDSELYDPSTATWSLTAPMRSASTSSVIAPLASGEVLAIGDGSLAQIYDPANDAWRATGAPTRSVSAMTLLGSGKVLSINVGPSGSSTSDLYDPVSGTWSRTGTNKTGRLSLTLLPSGKVLEVASGELYDPSAGSWSAAGLPSSDHQSGAATLLPSGKVMASGGSSAVPDLYDPGAGTWTATAALGTARSGATVTQLPGGKVLIAGGRGPSGPTATAELYDLAASAWTPTGSMNAARSRHTATLLTTGVVLVAGGDGAGGPLASAELYDPASGTWSATTSLAEARSGHTATLLANGAVLVAGGAGVGGSFLASAESFHPDSATWTRARPMWAARSDHTATRLLDGTVLAVGGRALSGPVGNADVYDPSTDLWLGYSPLSTPRANHTATLLPSGRVLVAGGLDANGAPLASTELYVDSSAPSWRAGGAMATARSAHTATLLPNGQVLVAGGTGAAGPLAGAEVYDEPADTWAPASALATARADAAALLLANGRALVAGGGAAAGSLASAELYDDTGASDAWRPSIAPIPRVHSGEQIAVTGSRLRGISEGSNGLWLGHSPSNVPVVSLLSLEGGLAPVALQGFTDTSLTFTVPTVPDGHYLLVATVNAMSSGAVVSVDGAPAAPALTAPAFFVSTYQPVIAGSAEAQATVTVAIDGTTLGDASAGASGSWSFVPASPLAGGPHAVAARATNAFGSAGPWSPPRSFVVDDSPPFAPSFSDCPTVLSSPMVFLAGRAEAYNQLTVWSDGVLRTTFQLGPIGKWQLTLIALSDGPHVATAQSTDRAGNTSPISKCAFTVDTVPPPAPEIASPAGGDVIASPTPVISGTAEGGSTVTVIVDASVLGTTTADGSGSWSLASPVTLEQGLHSLTAQAQDAAGNQGPAAAVRLFTVDSIAPPPPVVMVPAQDAVVRSALPLVSGTAEVGGLVTIWLDGAAAGTVGTNDSGAWSFIPPAPLTPGAHTVAAQATDMAGNNSTSENRSFLVQPASVSAPEISPIGAVSTALPRISGTATPGDSVTVMLDGAVAGTVWPDETGSWSFVPSTPLADGSHVASAQATDPLLNESPMASPVPFLVDTIAPPAPSMEAPGPDALVRTATPQLLGTTEPGSTVSVVLDGEAAGTPTAGDDGVWTLTPAEPLADGHHAVTLQAADAVGNVSPVSSPQSFTIQHPKSYYRGGCSAAPAGGFGAWLLLLGLGRRRRLLARRWATALAAGLGCLGVACSPGDVDRIRAPGTSLVGQAAEDVSSPGTRVRVADGAGALEVARSFFPELAPKQAGRALDPARMLRVTRSAGGMEIATRGRVFHVHALSGDDRRLWSPVDGDGAVEPWVTSRVEEYLVTEAGAAPYRERFEVTVPDGVVTIRDAGDFLELDDAEDVPVLRMHHALARDEWGHWRRGRAALQGAVPAGQRGGLPAYALRGGSFQVELAVGFEGLAGTVVVDPGWSSTGGLSSPRDWFTQTLLPTGQVLLAGGAISPYPTTAAELYDPQTGTWSSTGWMLSPQGGHAATPLLSGDVLTAGGFYPSGTAQGAAQLYDSVSGIWREPSSMVQPRDGITATLLPSGKVLVVGTNDSEIYDPATATWALAGPMVYPAYQGTATLLPSGKVLVGSGAFIGGDQAQLYDPENNAWSSTGRTSTSRSDGSATLLASGKVLLVGGTDTSGAFVSTSELYDPAAGTWKRTGASQLAASGMKTILLPSGNVLAVSGSSSQTYDPAAGKWRLTESIGSPFDANVATLLPSGKVLLTDGIDTTVSEVYDPGAGAWTATASQATARSGASATQLPGGKVLVAGGQGTSGPSATAELYDPATRAWLSTGSMGRARAWHTATLLPTGAVLVVGGTGTGGLLSDAELYDPVSGTWSPTTSLASARSGHTATLLDSGAVLVTGGSGTGVLASAELYHPLTGTWTSARSMSAGRTGHTATKLTSGEVLIAGGQTASGPLASTQLYDPSFDAWSAGASLREARTGHTATLLPSGHVLIAGGRSNTAPLAGAELYVPVSGAWLPGGAMAAARSGHSATLLASGKVLIAAGMGTTGHLASAEIYDEGLAEWSSGGTLATARADAAAILLVNGKVLVAGGNGAAGSLGSAELYEDTGASDAWRPSIASVSLVQDGEPFTVGGQRFRGLSEASNGSYAGNSPSNVPVVRLLPLGGGSRPVRVERFTDTSLTLTIPSFPSVPEGYYLLTVTVNAISGGAVVFFDAPPPAPVLTAPVPFVASTRPMIAGTAEPGSTVSVSVDEVFLGEASALQPLGDWSLVPASPLAEGNHSLKARATDGQGLSRYSSVLSFTVDTTPPAAPVFTGPEALTSPQPTLIGAAEPDTLVQLWVDGAVAGIAAASVTGAWSFTVTSPLGDGPHAATAQAQDAARNTSPISAARAFTVDAVPPTRPEILSPSSGAQVASRTPVISGTAESGSTVTVLVDGYVAGAALADSSGAWACTSSLALGEGAHGATAQATDAAGNAGQATLPRSFTVDSIAPAPPVVLTPSEGAVESSERPPISGNAEAGSRVAIWLDLALLGTVVTTGTGTWSFVPASPVGAGTHAVLAEATDGAGNSTFSANPRAFTVQPTRPATPRILTPAGVVGTAFPAIVGKAGSEDSVDVLLDDALAGTAWPDGQGFWSFTPTSPLADGPHVVAAQARDSNLNASPVSAPITLSVDTVAPPAPSWQAPVDDALLRTATPQLAGTAEAGSTVLVMLDGDMAGTPRADDTGDWTFTPPRPLVEGRHTATLQARDAAGNVGPASTPRSFTVQRPRSFYGSGCSAAPAGGLGGWLLMVALWRSAAARRRKR